MSTSLAEQLKKLRAPQTSILLQDKKRPSLLFDPKEAADLDREIILNIGQSGLEDLTKLCASFDEFKKTLFSRDALSLERSVEDRRTNERLDAGIEKFLILLSPYFLLNSAHKALEWLIHRFHIHRYNKDEFMMLILPYHETRIFVRALQLVDLSANDDRWKWLESLQKPGITLSSLTLVKRVATDDGLLKLLCGHVVGATRIFGDDANRLSTLYAFYTMSIVGAFVERTGSISEIQTSHVISSLAKGLTSSISDFQSSSYMILAKLSTEASLEAKTLDNLVRKAMKNPQSPYEAVLLIFFIYENSLNRPSSVSEKLALRLGKSGGGGGGGGGGVSFVEHVPKIKLLGLDVTKFIVPFIRTCLELVVVRAPEESQHIRRVLQELLVGVNFENREIDLILECMVKQQQQQQQQQPDDGLETSEEAKIFIANLYNILERLYPTRFEQYLKNLMRRSENDTSCKMTLQLLMSWHSGARNAKDSLDILDRLNHPSPYQRIAGLEIIARGEMEITETFREMVNKALIGRFSDQDSRVVKTLLKLPRERLKSLFPADTLVDELMTLLAQCNSQKQRGLAKLAIELLLDICEDVEDDTSIFIATLPYLFPSQNEEIDISMQILKSKYSEKNLYMKMVRDDVGVGGNGAADAEAISSAAFHNILKWQLLPPSANIVGTIKSQSCRGDATSMFFNLVLLGSVCRVPVGSLSNETALEIIEIAAEMTKYYPKVRRLSSCNQLNADKISEALALTSEGILPLQACTYVIEMVHRRIDIKTNPWIDFENDRERARLLLRLLEILFEGMSLASRRAHYSWCLKIFFQRHFSSSREMLVFLSQFFARPVNPQTSLHCLKVSLDILESSRTYNNWIFEDRIFVSNLLIALARPNDPCRLAAVEILKKISQTFNLTMPGFSSLFHELARKSGELSIDPEQLSLLLYTLLSPDPDVTHQLERQVGKNLEESRRSLIAKILEENTCVRTSAQLLDILTHVNGPEILVELSKFALVLNKKISDAPDSKEFTCQALGNIYQRFNSTSVESLLDSSVFELFELAMSDHRPIIIQTESSSGGRQRRRVSPSSIMIKQIDREFYDRARKLSPLLARKIFFKLVDVVTECEIGGVVAACNRAVRRIKIDAKMIVEELRRMKDARVAQSSVVANSSRSKRKSGAGGGGQLPSPEITNSADWKRGITILEFVQRAENIENEESLIPMLFEILRVSLSFEIQSPLEYVNQLVLSTIYHLATKCCPIEEAHLYIDLIAQCIRISHNPQTHHHALLVLVELFKIANVEMALHNIMPIFTFMGSSVLRQDDAYSIQIISKTIETVVPIVNSTNDAKHACKIIRIFVISLPHIPEHRRIPIFLKLLQLLDKHLHIFYLLTFEAHVLTAAATAATAAATANKDSPLSRKNSSERLEFALRISHEFSASRVFKLCVDVLKFVRSLPNEIENDAERKKIDFSGKHIFDVANNSAKQSRHYRYTVVQFLVALLSSPDFVNKIVSLEPEALQRIEILYDRVIVEIVLLVESSSRSADLHQGTVQAKYWKILLHNLYDLFDAVNNLLPNPIFITTIIRLLAHHLSTVRKKALELLNLRLHQKKFNLDDHQRLLPVVDSLGQIVAGKTKISSPELEIIQQTALIGLKLMAKLLAADNPAYFKPVLDLTTELMRTKEGPLLASAVLCAAELCASMRTHAIQSLNKFVPTMIHLLKTHCIQESPDFVVVSIVSALQKIVESVGNFLSLYLDQLLLELARLSSVYTDAEHPKIGLVVSRLKGTSEKLASSIPLRVLLPAVSQTYDLLIASKLYRSVSPLLNIIGESFGNVPTNELQASIPDLATFFLKVLEFRENVEIGDDARMEIDDTVIATSHDVSSLEESASRALVALVLKLSEATFRPLYYKLYDWAARFPEKKQRNITFYRLSANIAERLKSLFVLFAGHFLKHASSLLRANNLSVIEEPCELTLPEESPRIELIEAILLTLYRVFGYDAHNFVNQERFEALAQPIVDQLENTMGTKQEFDKRANDLVVPCIAAFAGAIQDDSLHKQLVYQTLLKTRHTKPYVRSAALSALVEIARKLGEDFMPLLPETVPFLAELLEDEDECTEKSAQNAVRTLEDILGEPLQKYF